jgi:uncharacterized protein involved in outer membrane biogenesis
LQKDSPAKREEWVRNLVIGIAVVLVLLVGALFAVPSLVGAGQMTAFLTERLRGATGYNVSIRGPVAVALLPSPRLTVSDIHVLDGAKPDSIELARAGTLDAHVALLPLLGGRVEVTALTLRDPVVAWDAALKQAKPGPQAPPAPAASIATPAAPAGSKFSVAVHHIQVVNGSLSYADAGRTYQVEHLDLDLETAEDGAISGTADTSVKGDGLHVEGRVGAVDCARPVLLFLHATGAAGTARLDFDGSFRCDAGRLTRADGKLKLAADSAGAALAPFVNGALPPALDRPLALNGTLNGTLGADGAKADLTDLILDLDQSHGVGTLSAGFADHPSIDLALDFNRLDLDKWLVKAASAAPTPTPTVTTTPAATSIVPPAPASMAPSAPSPSGVHIGLDLSAELLSWRGSLIRQARFNGGIDQGTVTINQATAEMPAGTDFSVSGQIADVFAAPHFVGTVDAETDDFRTVVGWAGIKLDGVPADRLRQASLSTDLDLSADRASATGIDLGLDGGRFRGAANLVFGPRPAIGLRLAGDQLNLDAYLPQPAAVAAPVVPRGDAAPAPAAMPPPPVQASPVQSSPVITMPQLLAAANLDLSLDSMTWRGQLLKGVHLAGAIEGGATTIREARIDDLNGGKMTLSGQWAAGSLSGQMSASGPSAAPLLLLAGLAGQDFATRLGSYQLDLKVGGSLAALDVDGALAARDGRLTAKGRVNVTNPHFTGAVTFDHPEAARVLAGMAAAAPLYRPAGGTLGALAFSAGVDASADRVALDHLSLGVGSQQVTGTASFDRTVQPPRLNADLAGGDLVLDPFLPARDSASLSVPIRLAALGDAVPLPGHWSLTPLDLGWLDLLDATVKLSAASTAVGPWHLDKPSLAATLKGGTLGLDRLQTGLFGGSVAAHGSLAGTAGATLALTLAGKDLDLKELAQHLGLPVLTAGTGALDADVTASGASQAALIASLGGKATLAARDGGLGGLDLPAIDDRLAALKGPEDLVGVLQAVQAGGTTRFSALDASAAIANGVVRSTDLHLAADGGDVTGSVTADLPAWTIDGHAQLALKGKTGELPPLPISFEGPLDHPDKRVDTKALASYVEKQGLSKLIEGLAAQQPATPASPSQQQQKPAQQLRNLLKGLIAKPNP